MILDIIFGCILGNNSVYFYTTIRSIISRVGNRVFFSEQRKWLGFSKWTKINVQKSFSVGKNLQKNP